MSGMSNILKQRGRIVGVMRRLERLSVGAASPRNARASSASMVELLRLMQLHNAQKLYTVYAPAKLHGDQDKRAIAADFHREEQELIRDYALFAARWKDPAIITSKFAVFQTEVAETLAAITDRGHRERELLFALGGASPG